MKKLPIFLSIFLLMTLNVETHNFDMMYVVKHIDLRQTKIKNIASYYGQDYELIKYIYDVSGNYDIDPLLFVSLIQIESSFISNARSDTGAIGYCQITRVAIEDLNVELNRFSPKENILIGVMFLDKLIKRYENITNALVHYNAGTVDEAKGLRYAKRILREYENIKEL